MKCCVFVAHETPKPQIIVLEQFWGSFGKEKHIWKFKISILSQAVSLKRVCPLKGFCWTMIKLHFLLAEREIKDLGDYLMDCDDFWCKISGNASTFWENQNFWSRTATISHKVDFSKMIFSVGQRNPILAVVWQCGTKIFDFPRKYMYFLRVCAKNHPIPSSSLWDLWLWKIFHFGRKPSPFARISWQSNLQVDGGLGMEGARDLP